MLNHKNRPAPRARKWPRHPLQQRLIEFAILVCRTVSPLAKDFASIHIVQQLIRCATSVPANYAEARSAISSKEFVHKMSICLKELRESDVWLQILDGVHDGDPQCEKLIDECDELTALFVSSVQTARKNALEKRVSKRR